MDDVEKVREIRKDRFTQKRPFLPTDFNPLKKKYRDAL